MTIVTITEEPLALEDLLAIVDGARVELADSAREVITASRAVVDRALSRNEAVYGLTTQVGHGKDTRLTEEEIRGEQMFLVMSHSGGIGPPLPTPQVRAALTVRLNGIARGGSGASPAVADVLVAMLNAGVHPVVPEIGSVGAGDLGPMAGMAQVAVGQGRAEYQGERLSGGEALRRAGITPLALSGKDGLALVSANGVSIGHAALVVARAERAAAAADVAAALSMEATGANPSILHPAVARAKPIPRPGGGGRPHPGAPVGERPASAGRTEIRTGCPLVPGRAPGARGTARVRRCRPECRDRRAQLCR